MTVPRGPPDHPYNGTSGALGNPARRARRPVLPSQLRDLVVTGRVQVGEHLLVRIELLARRLGR